MSTPYWVRDAIFYQIFPDRFANGDPHNDPPNVQPWGSSPQIGDFKGVIYSASYSILIIYSGWELMPYI